MPEGVDPQLLRALESLKSAHRRYLLDTINFPPDATNDEKRLEWLASTWGADELERYDGLYRPGNGALFTWWLPAARENGGEEGADPLVIEARDMETLHRDLLERVPGVGGAGLRPRLEYGQAPALHKIVRWPDRIEVQYASAEKPRLVRDGWDERMVQPLKIYHAYIKEEPFSVEMRAVPRSKQPELLRLMEQDLGLQLGAPQACLLTTNALEEALCRSMGALYFGVHQLGNGNAGLDYTIIKTDRTISIVDQEDFKEQLAHEDRREYFKRFYYFGVVHADGYHEQCLYTVKVTTGELSVGRNISELAVEALRRNVIALF